MHTTCKITEAGLHIPGVQFRNESPKHIWPIEARNGDLVAVRFPPGTCWSGVGRPHRYIPAEIVVFRVTEQGKGKKKETCLEEVFRIPVRQVKKVDPAIEGIEKPKRESSYQRVEQAIDLSKKPGTWEELTKPGKLRL